MCQFRLCLKFSVFSPKAFKIFSMLFSSPYETESFCVEFIEVSGEVSMWSLYSKLRRGCDVSMQMEEPLKCERKSKSSRRNRTDISTVGTKQTAAAFLLLLFWVSAPCNRRSFQPFGGMYRFHLRRDRNWFRSMLQLPYINCSLSLILLFLLFFFPPFFFTS